MSERGGASRLADSYLPDRAPGRARRATTDPFRLPVQALAPIYGTTLRTRLRPPGFIEPCQPISALTPPRNRAGFMRSSTMGSGSSPAATASAFGSTPAGDHWRERYTLAAEAVAPLAVRSCAIDGEVIVCDCTGLAGLAGIGSLQID
jgi:hypothetical protein